MDQQRRDEIATRLGEVRGRIDAACADCRPRRRRRSPWSWSPSSSRPPTSGCSPTSASATWGRTVTRRRWTRRPSAPTSTCTWHFIGALQSNKAAAVAAYADVVQSVDRAKLRRRARRGAAERGRRARLPRPGQPRPARRRRPLRRSESDRRRRRSPSAISEAEGLRLRGVMAVAPLRRRRPRRPSPGCARPRPRTPRGRRRRPGSPPA